MTPTKVADLVPGDRFQVKGKDKNTPTWTVRTLRPVVRRGKDDRLMADVWLYVEELGPFTPLPVGGAKATVQVLP